MRSKTGLWILGIIVLVLLAIGIYVVFLLQPGPDYEEVSYLIQPQIADLEEESVLAIDVSGNPTSASADAIAALMRALYKIPGVDTRKDNPPKARWTGDLLGEDPESAVVELHATFAVEVPSGTAAAPGGVDPRLYIDTWEYGTVAQILHVGPYGEEVSTIKRLREFIDESGYQISGPHEEVYLKGPNMFGFGNADDFLTIIRYQVEEVPVLTETP